MQPVPESNRDYSYFNNNVCASANFNVTSSLTKFLVLSASQPCSEVIIYNPTGGTLTVYDGNRVDPFTGFIIGAGEYFTLRGITNVDTVSATRSAPGTISIRTQYFSMNPNR